ncbi:contact-dependent growth inhibition system immunity protein [Amycolatopsis sp.]|jgi:hypothetical protein|uniref:contact-dependent growth inhibition system immunity protein n=1 Tax=Amycolatopsis sp. TaxID=37632 RepID=UPI002DF99FE1|nr:contact-dependent growth inhibition system immunity protein [Amycolatopsis sp.]
MEPEIRRDRSLEDVEGDRWAAPSGETTYLISEVHKLRRKSVGELTVEDLRLLIGQLIGLPVLVPLAIEKLRLDPLAEGHMYEGDLLASVVRVGGDFWTAHPTFTGQVGAILDGLPNPPDLLARDIKRFRELTAFSPRDVGIT